MSNREFKFILFNFANQERKEFVTKNKSMNEAISEAYIRAHGLRKTGKDNWQIISATDSVTNSL